jgi:hypothetical protein
VAGRLIAELSRLLTRISIASVICVTVLFFFSDQRIAEKYDRYLSVYNPMNSKVYENDQLLDRDERSTVPWDFSPP